MKSKKRRKRRIAKIIGLGTLLAVVIVIVSFTAASMAGKHSLQREQEAMNAQVLQISEQEVITQKEQEQWQQGWIKFENQIYAYNEDIMTFLFMGIDKDHEVTMVAEGTDGGQADALFLLVLNPHDKSIKVISVNRNTMTDIDLYDAAGEYIDTIEAQIAVQHGFGNGVEESCEYQVQAVRRLFYNLPIHGYCSINMDAIIELTNLVGGIELTAIEDVTSAIQDETLGAYLVNKGETVLLDGRKAYSYVRYRNADVEGSADLRLKRQQQFMEAFMYKVLEAVKQDITIPIKLYNAVTSYMVTDVTAEEVAYLTSVVADYRFDATQFYSLQGETVQGEEFEEFYVDEEELYRLIVEIFYEPVIQ